MARRLFGIETEYAVTDAGSALPQQEDARVWRLIDTARRELKHISDFGEGIFLENGSRFYIDAGYHPELSTPECTHPTEVLRYVLAGEQILLDLVDKLDGHAVTAPLNIFKNNVDYSGSGTTWGCHESYMHRMPPDLLSPELIPHLVSRVIYTGAGGFDSLSPGLMFTLSPRVPHLERVVSGDSTAMRGIFHTKDESLSSAEYHRLHIICGESLWSQTAIWLKVATTALVVAMAEAGIRFSDTLKLRAPLTAMRGFASDPSCKATALLTDRRWMTAIEIQRVYLRHAEKRLRERFMPDWAGEACALWRSILDRLEHGYQAVNTTLDWAIKLTLFRDFAAREGMQWEMFPRWTHVHKSLAEALGRTEASDASLGSARLLAEVGPVRDTVQSFNQYLNQHGLRWEGFDRYLRVRRQLMEIDTRMGQLGEGGIFTRLAKSGTLNHEIEGVGNVRDYIRKPPSEGRARLRGEFIRKLGGDHQRYAGDWQGVWDRTGKRFLDLSDPFASSELWSTLDEKAQDMFWRIPVGLRQAVRYAEGYSTY